MKHFNTTKNSVLIVFYFTVSTQNTVNVYSTLTVKEIHTNLLATIGQ